MYTGYLLNGLRTCSRFDDFVAQTFDKCPERFSKSIITVGDQYLLGCISHSWKEEHKGCQAAQKRSFWRFLASSDHPETLRREGSREGASVRKAETSRHPGIFTSCICRRIAGYQHVQLSWAHLPPAIYLPPYRE